MKQLKLPMLCEELYSIDMGKSGKLLRAFVDAYNEDRPMRERIRSNHMALMEKLLHIYRVNLWQQQEDGLVLVPGCPLPYLETNNGQLRHYLKCTERSVQHLRHRLKAAGLILEEIWHGSQRDYEMRLNPAVIHLGKAGDKTNYVGLFNGAPQRKNSDCQSENFSPNCTQQKKLVTNKLNELEIGFFTQSAENQNIKLISSVEKHPICVKDPLKTVENPQNSRSDEELAGYETIEDTELGTPPRVADSPPAAEMRNEERGMASPLPSASLPKERTHTREQRVNQLPPQTFGEAVAHLPDKLGRAIFTQVSQIWEIAMKELYEGEWIAHSERERAKARLAEYFIYADPKRYSAGKQEICERIRLVRKWIERGLQAKLERWVPIPSLFFDCRNPRGFRVTKAWYKSHLENRQDIDDNIALAKAVRTYRRSLNRQTGSSHLKTGVRENSRKAASPVQSSPIELYQQTVARLARRNEALVTRFQQEVLHLWQGKQDAQLTALA